MASHELTEQAGDTRRPRRLGDVLIVSHVTGCSPRHFLRMAADGRAPKGVKLGALRRWDLRQIEEWIEAGCPAVGEGGGR